MPQNVRIALDAMGGDVGAPVIVPGADISLLRHPDTEFLLFGDRSAIEPLLEERPGCGPATIACRRPDTTDLQVLERLNARIPRIRPRSF